MKAFIKRITAFLRRTFDDAVLESDESFLVPAPAAAYPVSPHVMHHTPDAAYVNKATTIVFEEDYVEKPARKKPGPKPRFATEEERIAHRKKVGAENHKKRYANPEYRQARIDYMRARRKKTAETVRGWSKRNIGISTKDDRKAYNRAYYEQTKKTGNTAETFSRR